MEIVTPRVGLAVAVEEDEAFDRASGIAAESTVFQFDGRALAERERF